MVHLELESTKYKRLFCKLIIKYFNKLYHVISVILKINSFKTHSKIKTSLRSYDIERIYKGDRENKLKRQENQKHTTYPR
jgi:hypothetical protein